MTRFYLGTGTPAWVKRIDVPLFVSHVRLRGYVNPPKALGRWSLDSGGFTQLSQHGVWKIDATEYAEAATRYASRMGRLDWASPQDWMCEPWVIAKTGKSVAEHQERTVASLLELRALAPDVHFIPVLQGWELADYERCAELYASAGIDLKAERTVGLGSVCRRQSTEEIGAIVKTFASEGYRLHGFGVKLAGLKRYGALLESADSMAWSFSARWTPVRLDGCEHDRCQNCMKWALKWRNQALDALGASENERSMSQ